VDALDAPVLVVDLDALDRTDATVAPASASAAWRPHVKVHKTPAIAHRQLAAGAIGIACAKLGKAEVMAAAGIRDIMVANRVVGEIKARRLAALCRDYHAIEPPRYREFGSHCPKPPLVPVRRRSRIVLLAEGLPSVDGTQPPRRSPDAGGDKGFTGTVVAGWPRNPRSSATRCASAGQERRADRPPAG